MECGGNADAGEALLKIGQAECERPLNHPANHQAKATRVDTWNRAVITNEKEIEGSHFRLAQQIRCDEAARDEEAVVVLRLRLAERLLDAHLAGGLRLLALEFLAWRDWQKGLLAAAAGVTLAAGLLFLLNVLR